MDILRRWWSSSTSGSGSVAKNRLKLVLFHDRLDLSPEVVDQLKGDMLVVLSRYFDIDQDSLELDVQRGGQYNRLVTSISVRRPT